MEQNCWIGLKLFHWRLRLVNLYFYYERVFPNLLNLGPLSYARYIVFFWNLRQGIGMEDDKRYWDQILIEQFGDANWVVKTYEFVNKPIGLVGP